MSLNKLYSHFVFNQRKEISIIQIHHHFLFHNDFLFYLWLNRFLFNYLLFLKNRFVVTTTTTFELLTLNRHFFTLFWISSNHPSPVLKSTIWNHISTNRIHNPLNRRTMTPTLRVVMSDSNQTQRNIRLICTIWIHYRNGRGSLWIVLQINNRVVNTFRKLRISRTLVGNMP